MGTTARTLHPKKTVVVASHPQTNKYNFHASESAGVPV
jgi:hypothetical protein